MKRMNPIIRDLCQICRKKFHGKFHDVDDTNDDNNVD